MTSFKIKNSTRFSFQNTNFRLLILCILCSVYGCILVFSANVAAGNGLRGVIVQVGASVAGLMLAIFISRFDYENLCNVWYIFGGFAVLLVLLTFTPLGLNAAGTDDTAWLGIGFGSFMFTFQPSELLKIAFVMSFAHHVSLVKDNISDIKNVILLCLHACIPIGLILLQGDDGTALVFIFMFACMMWVAGLKWQYFAAAFTAIAAAIPILWFFFLTDDKKGRILAILRPEEYVKTYGWQQEEGITLIGSGKLFGVGLLNGSNPTLFARNNDLIFTVAAEEFGFIGAVVLLALLALLIIELWHCTTRARDTLGSLICVGAMAMIGFQSIINIGMNVRLLPVIGITLPFFSAGGSSVLTLYLMIGLVLSVCYYSNVKSTAIHR